MSFRTILERITLIAILVCIHGTKAESQNDLLVPIDRLYLYSMGTQVGTVAKAEKLDKKGRLAHLVYFNGSIEHPKETLEVPTDQHGEWLGKLRPVVVEYYSYDHLDRLVETRRHAHAPNLPQVPFLVKRVYEGDLKKESIITYLNLDGTKSHEIRRPDGGKDWRKNCTLYFDSDGGKVVYFRGPLPDDVTWEWGWGEAVDGYRCAVSACVGRAEMKEIQFAINVLNESQAEHISLVDAYRTVLTNSAGEVVPHRKEDSERDRYVRSINTRWPKTDNNYRLTSTGGVSHCDIGDGAMVRHDEKLTNWYEDLSPGRYQLRIEMPLKDPKKFELVSPAIEIEIIAPPPTRAMRGDGTTGLKKQIPSSWNSHSG
jgi:hypothetical protein